MDKNIWVFVSQWYHYNDVIMDAMASQITSLTIVFSTVYSKRRSKKTSKLLVTGLCAENSPVTSEFPRTKGQLRGNCFHLMTSSWSCVTPVVYPKTCNQHGARRIKIKTKPPINNTLHNNKAAHNDSSKHTPQITNLNNAFGSFNNLEHIL